MAIYVALNGADDNDGTEGSPVRTWQYALTLLAGAGHMIVRGGDWSGETLNLATARGLTISGYLGERVRVIGGEAVTSFTLHSGNVWKAAVNTTPFAGNEYVFEWNRPNSAGTCEHTPLVKASSIANVDASAGRWYVTGGFLYIRTPDSDNPNGRTFYIPHPSASITSGGTSLGRVIFNRIESYFWQNGFDISNLWEGKFYDCKAIGNGNEGYYGADAIWCADVNCEAAWNSNDGVGWDDCHQWTTVNVNCHDNHDKGLSGHYSGRHVITGGTSARNATGVTSYGGVIALIDGLTTTLNRECGIQNYPDEVGDVQPIYVSNWISDGDAYVGEFSAAFQQWAQQEVNRAILTDCAFRNCNIALSAVNAFSFITGTNITFENVTTQTGGFWVNDNITLIP